MATGDRNFSTHGKVAKKFESTPLPAGDYTCKLLTREASVQKKPDPGSLPYIPIRLEVLDTATTEGGKNRLIFHQMFCSLKSGKGGSTMVERADQLVGLAASVGEEANLPIITMQGRIDANGTLGPVDVIHPQVFVKWLQEKDGQIVKLRTGIKKADGQYPASTKIAYFIEADAGGDATFDAGFGEGAVEEAAPEEAAPEVVEEEVVEEEPTPPPTRKVAPPKAAAKPPPRRR